MTKHSIAAACALTLAAVGFTSTSLAGTGKDVKATKQIQETIKESCITGDIGVTVVSEYISRGLVLENQGVIAQPYLDLYFKLYEGTGFVNKVSFNLGMWSSIHSHIQPQPTTSTTSSWYEFDYTAGLAITFAKNFTFTASYFEFDSPADAFLTARSINFNLAYDDTDLLGAFALHPHVTYLHELTAPGFAGLGADGNYYEIGLAPGHTFGPVSLTVPLTVGLGSNNFYAGETFGYASAGLQASVPLSFVPECYGKWSFSGGYTYYYLGDNVKNATATGHQSQHVLQGGVGLTF